MKKYTLKRILTSLFTLLAILLVLFILMQLMPGSPFNDEKLTPDMRAALYAKYGLDQPIYIQFFRYVGNMLRGDLGVSYNISKNTPISQLIQSRLPISIQVGGMKMDEAIVNYIRKEFQLIIGERTAEDVKLDLASAVPLNDPRKVKIRGRAVNSPVPQDIDFTTTQAAEAIKEPCMAILAAIKWVLERTPPELSADIMRGGIHLTGGGAQLFGLDQYIATELGIPVLLAKEPMDCSALGLGYLVENLQLLQSIGKQGFMQVE